MSSPEIGDLFEHSRVRCGFNILPLLLYAPVGLVLALVRFFIGLHTFLISKLLPKSLSIRRWILRGMCFVLGIVVRTENSDRRSKSAKVVVSNHLSPLDHLAINLVLPNIIPCVWDIPDGLAWAMGFTDMSVRQGRDVLINKVTKHCQASSLPVLCFPEGGSTSGKVGLLKFSTWPFMLKEAVQPLSLRITRLPLFQVSLSPVGSTWWADLFWVLFLPYTIFTVRYLPVLVKEEEESVDEFSKRGQESIATDLQVKTTSFLDTDKVEYAKRILFEQSQSQGSTQSSATTSSSNAPSDPIALADLETMRMAKQVRDVLPHVPNSAILSDLVKTKNVDLTITNIVEGRVEFTPLDESESSGSGQGSSGPELSRFAADNFGKSSSERQLSFQERKKAMIANARKKFLKKHALL